jgi:hypothetical protein
MKMILTTLLILTCVAVTATAQCPNAVGQWTTNNGSLFCGRASEAYCAAYGYPAVGGVPGNTQNAMSFDGVALGTQWRAYGMEIDANGAVLISDTVDPGTGTGAQTYHTHYDGGQFWLSRNYSWADGLADLTGQLTSFLVVTTISYVGGVPQGAASNITFMGTFDNCDTENDCSIEFAIATAFQVWRPEFGPPMPTGYPPFLCGAATGELYDVCGITLTIDCAVPVEQTTWSGLKNLYR